MDLLLASVFLTQKMAKNGRIFYCKFANPWSFFDFSGGWGGTILHNFGIFHTRRYIKDFKVPFFRGPSSAVNFECQLLSVEPDHDYEIEKLC